MGDFVAGDIKPRVVALRNRVARHIVVVIFHYKSLITLMIAADDWSYQHSSMDIIHQPFGEFGLLGLSTAQLWVVIILAQVGVLLWFSRRISSYAGIDQAFTAGTIDAELSPGDWESRTTAQRLRQLKAESFERLSKLPPVSTERVTRHNGWRTALTVSRENTPDGALLIRVAPIAKWDSSKGSKGYAFIVRPDGTIEEANA